ncbi:hypothetical protein GC175_28865 [bacterium]|nr:hypothetical protein [bacterium]
MTILIIADVFDVHADLVEKKLRRFGVEPYRLNLDVESLTKTLVTYADSKWVLHLEASKCLDLSSVKKVYLRRAFVEIPMEQREEQDDDLRIWENEWNRTLTGMYYALRNASWINPFRQAFAAENKYYQYDLAHQIGFRIPQTLVSNERKSLINFCERHETTVIKLMSQDFYGTRQEGYKSIYVNQISPTDLHEFGEVGENPVVLQEYVPKQFEVRYTVVADSHFACRIESQKSQIAEIDWRRYDIPHTPHSSTEPPHEIHQKVAKLMQQMGLVFGALDFVVTPQGEWYFLEINPMGQWLWIEELVEAPISDSIVQWLHST